MRVWASYIWIGIAVFLAVFLTLVYFMWALTKNANASNSTMVTIYCTAGASYCDGTSAAETIIGSSGSDRIRAYGGNDYIAGNGGSDTILAGGGNDKLLGGPGRDTMTGGTGTDRAYGAQENDYFYFRDCVGEYVDGGPGIDSGMFDRAERYVSVEYRSEAWCV